MKKLKSKVPYKEEKKRNGTCSIILVYLTGPLQKL